MGGESEQDPMTPAGGDAQPFMRSAISIIHAEHKGFATTLRSLDRYLRPVMEHGLRPNYDLFGTILSYLDTFMDRFHHPKEDEHLFRAVRERTGRADATFLELQHEHAVGPVLLRELQEALARTRGGAASDIEAFAGQLNRYTKMQEAHMRRENEIIIPLACEVLTAADWQAIDEAFRENLDPLFGTGRREPWGFDSGSSSFP